MFSPLPSHHLLIKSVDTVFRIGVTAVQTAWFVYLKNENAPVAWVSFGVLINRLRLYYDAVASVWHGDFLTVSITSLKQCDVLPNRKRA